MGAKKRYIPKSRHNPEVQARRIDQLKDEIENQRRLLEIVTLSYKALKDCTGEKKIEIAAEVDGEFCIIAIKDTGCGIKDEDVNRVFDYKFTTTNGCGIGLYHAKYVCDEIGGEISFQRNVDVFSTVFIIKFPVNGTKEDINN